jgi:hypothetical protein
MRGAVPPLPNTTTFCGAQSKHRDNSTFSFTLTHVRTSKFWWLWLIILMIIMIGGQEK